MGLYLNKDGAEFESYLYDDIFIDKSLLIKTVNNNLTKKSSKYMCVTRPRRFGKSLALSMLNAYYSKGCDSKELFKGLKIETDESYLKHLNKHNVIWIDMADLYTNLDDCNNFVKSLKSKIFRDLKKEYPNIITDEMLLNEAFTFIYNETKDRFIFLIDEWDVIFREEEHNKILCDEYIKFLRGLFKSGSVSNCIDLVYMTGILPIKRYSTESALNMFEEYNMIDPQGLAEFFGFTEEETKDLCDEYNVDFNKVKTWYDGYKLNGIELYNPRSVVKVVTTKKFGDYWTETSAIESIIKYLKYENGDLKDVLASLMTGSETQVDVSLFRNDLTQIYSADSALTVLIHLGYLAYDEVTKSCYIPNYEILKEFERAVKVINWKEYSDPIKTSLDLYDATIKGDLDFINKTLDYNHQLFSTMYSKNSESVLQIIVYLSYFNCNDFYYIMKEASVSTGRADLVFVPKDHNHIPMIVELKVNETVDTALNQIKDKKYVNLFDGYHGKLLFVGINYDSKTLTHDSKTEYIEI